MACVACRDINLEVPECPQCGRKRESHKTTIMLTVSLEIKQALLQIMDRKGCLTINETVEQIMKEEHARIFKSTI